MNGQGSEIPIININSKPYSSMTDDFCVIYLCPLGTSELVLKGPRFCIAGAGLTSIFSN